MGVTEGLAVDKKRKENKDKPQNTQGYVFDPDDVVEEATFPVLKINSKSYAFGLLMPKYEPQRNKKGEVTHIEQIRAPTLITNDGTLFSLTKTFESSHKIKFSELPEKMPLRWSLPSIEKYIQNKHEEINGFELFTKIKDIYKKYCYFRNENWYDVHALWDIGTYFFMLFKAYPIFELRGMPGSGKTKIMSISNSLTFNACDEIMINPSEATLFRETHVKRITKYIDEAEKLFKIEKGKVIPDDRVTFINQSYSCNGAVPRQEKIGNRYITKYFRAYSPTMIGSINGLYGATESRAIVQITTKNPKNDTRGELEFEKDDFSIKQTRDELYVFALHNWKQIETAYNHLINDTELKSRDFQIWKPILVIAKILNEELYNIIKDQAKKLTEVKEETVSEGSVEYKILKTMYNLINANKFNQDCILVKHIYNDYPDKEYRPSHKNISGHLDRLGFMEYGKKTNEGKGYQITADLFNNIVSLLNTDIFPSLSSQKEEKDIIISKNDSDANNKKMTNSDEKERKVTKKSDESDANDESDADFDFDVSFTKLEKNDFGRCSYCNSDTFLTHKDSNGFFACESCVLNYNIKEEKI